MRYVIERVLGVRDCDSHEMSLVSRRAEALQSDDEVVAYHGQVDEHWLKPICGHCPFRGMVVAIGSLS